jgi:hypothetical protein
MTRLGGAEFVFGDDLPTEGSQPEIEVLYPFKAGHGTELVVT